MSGKDGKGLHQPYLQDLSVTILQLMTKVNLFGYVSSVKDSVSKGRPSQWLWDQGYKVIYFKGTHL